MMRTSFKFHALALVLLVAGAGFVSCSSGDDETPQTPPPVTPTDPVDPTADEALSPADQKEKLESVALEVSDVVQASDFDNIASLGRFMRNEVAHYDNEALEDWGQSTLETMMTAVGEPVTVEDEGYDWIDRYITRNYNALVVVSQFKGHFTARNRRWEKSNADDLQFIFNDQQGRKCTLSLATSGTTVDLHATDVTRQDWNYGYEDEKWIYEYITTHTNVTVHVPQHIVVTLTQNGATVVKVSVDLNLSGLVGTEFNIARSSLTAACKIELNNGYIFNLSQVAYTPNSNAAVSFTATKGGTTITTIAASATPAGIPSANLSALMMGDKPSFDSANGKNALVKVDVLGEVQVQGTLTDVRQFLNYLNMARANDNSESKFKSYISLANGCMDINLFYDNNSVKQATVKLEPFEEWGNYWKAEPALNFYDGSSYCTFEAFFNRSDFQRVINAYSQLIDDFRALVK